jgi:hypothetical protein
MHKYVVKLTTVYLVCKQFLYFTKSSSVRRLENSDTQKQSLYLQIYVKVSSYLVILLYFVRLITKHYKTKEKFVNFLLPTHCAVHDFSLPTRQSRKVQNGRKWHTCMSLPKAPDCRIALSSSCGSWDSLSRNVFCLICKLIRRNVFPYRRTLYPLYKKFSASHLLNYTSSEWEIELVLYCSTDACLGAWA